MRAVGRGHMPDVHGGRPMAADGRGKRTVLDGQGDGVCGQRDEHVPGARARVHAGVRDGGHGAVPAVPAGDVHQAHVARGAHAAGWRRQCGRHGRVLADSRAWRVARPARRTGPRAQDPQRVPHGERLRTRRRYGEMVVADPGDRGHGRVLLVPQCRRHFRHHQILRRVENVSETMTETRFTFSTLSSRCAARLFFVFIYLFLFF